jgi:hypothetical protein
LTEDEFAALEEGNPQFEVLERVAIVRHKADGEVAIAVLRKMPDGTLGDDGQLIYWRNVCYRLEPGAWEGIQAAIEDPKLLRDRIAEARKVLEGLGRMEPQGRA